MGGVKLRWYSDRISRLRYAGNLDEAVKVCEEAITEYPENNFFYKVKGDLWLQQKDYEKAADCYLEQLKHLGKKLKLFGNFARFYNTYSQRVSRENLKEYRERVLAAVEKHEIEPEISEKVIALLGEENYEILDLIYKGGAVEEIRTGVEKLVRERQKEKIALLLQKCIKIDFIKNWREIYLILIAAAERMGLYELAVELLVRDERVKREPVMIRTLLRVSRKQNDYTKAELFLTLDRAYVDSCDFNVLYELVYYFGHNQNEEMLKHVLKQMRRAAESSLPIARTLYNFYLQYNYFSEARQILDHIKALEEKTRQKKGKDRMPELMESEEGVWNKLQELVSDREHNRQMIAMRDLIRGFSHELGQPITNIRYAIQLYRMRLYMGKLEENSVNMLMDQILRQTERMGEMLDRFRPIVSRENVIEQFHPKERIEKVFYDMEERLRIDKINYKVSGDETLELNGEAVQFDQIFYNLVLNAMQAFDKKETSKQIDVNIYQDGENDIKITFADNGPGIAEQNVKKIFEPFFTTKAPSTDNGGEGLGLFIVWNILKMFDGTISLDTTYKNGAKFNMKIPNQKETKNE